MAPASSSSSTSNRTSSVIPNLDNAPLNFKFLREQSVKDVIKLLDNIRGRKCLVLDRTLSGSLTLLLPTTFLKEHGVEQFIRLSPVRKLPGSGHSSPSDAIQGDVSKVIYLIRSQLDLARLVSSHIHHDLAPTDSHETTSSSLSLAELLSVTRPVSFFNTFTSF